MLLLLCFLLIIISFFPSDVYFCSFSILSERQHSCVCRICNNGEIAGIVQKVPILEYKPSSLDSLLLQVTQQRAYPKSSGNQHTVEFDNGAQHSVSIEINSTSGQLVRSVNQSVIPNTGNKIHWNGLSENNSRVEKGFYILLLKTEDGVIIGITRLSKTL